MAAQQHNSGGRAEGYYWVRMPNLTRQILIAEFYRGAWWITGDEYHHPETAAQVLAGPLKIPD